MGKSFTNSCASFGKTLLIELFCWKSWTDRGVSVGVVD